MYFSREKSTCRARGCRTTNCIAAGHHEQFCNPGLLEEIQHLGRIEFARDHALGAVIEAHHAPAGAADMEDRHRHQRDVVGRPFVPFRLLGLVAGLHQIEEIGMRQHRALGLAGGARGIELDRDVLRARSAPSGSSPLWASRQAVKSCHSGAPPSVVMTVRTSGNCGLMLRTWVMNSGPTNSTGALQSPTMKATSGPARRQLTGAITTWPSSRPSAARNRCRCSCRDRRCARPA